jgi:urease accessory protein UreE
MLEVFRSLPVAREVCSVDAVPAIASAYARDTVTLGWEDRLKARGRRRTDGGVEFGTTLPRGTILRDGDCFVLDQDHLVITIVAREEAVFVIEPAMPSDWGLFAYQIGNSHQPLMFTAHEIVCPDLPGMEQVLTYHAIPYVRGRRPFTPVTQVPNHEHRR